MYINFQQIGFVDQSQYGAYIIKIYEITIYAYPH